MGAACELGVAHPPGYPLFTMLSWLGIQLIPVGCPGNMKEEKRERRRVRQRQSNQVIARLGGVASPTTLTRSQSAGYRMNCVSVIFGVLASFFHFKTVLRWHLVQALLSPSSLTRISSQGLYHPRGQDNPWIGSAWIAMLSSGLMSFCPLIWQYSTHTEVNLLLIFDLL